MAGRQARDRAVRHAAGARRGSYSFTFAGDDHIDWYQAVARLGSERAARKVFNRGIDHTGRKAFTRVRREVAKQVGLPQKRLADLGRLKYTSARNTHGPKPMAEISSTGRYLPLSEFKPRQFAAGVKASPWGRREQFEGAFMFSGNRKSGMRMPSGFVFVNSRRFNSRSGRDNLPLPLWGPAIPNELLKDKSREAFEAASKGLGDRIKHEVAAITGGVVG